MLWEEVIQVDLKPCPMCGGVSEMIQQPNNEKYIYCTKCGITFLPQSVWNAEEFINAYNKRFERK